MNRVWRIGTNWGGQDVLPLFKKYKIAFAGKEIANTFKNIKPGDLICITKGQEIVAIGKAGSLKKLDQIDPFFIKKYNSVTAVMLTDLFLKDDYTNIDFGEYGGRGRQFTQSHGDYVQLINSNYLKILSMQTSEEIIKILRQKNQIILQGPPGTGKTRMAESIAKQLTSPNNISEEDILRIVSLGLTIKSTNGKVKYEVVAMSNNHLDYQRDSTGNNGRLNFSDIIKAYSSRKWESSEISGGSGPYSAAFAKYIYENYESDKVKIIQFHPAYSYEDLVRGITVKSEGDRISYETQNRILAEFATEAYANQVNSSKNLKDYSIEKYIEGKINEYVEYLSELLDDEDSEEPQLTKAIRITEIEDNAFKFHGTSWYDRLKFDQIRRMFLLGLRTSSDIRDTPGFVKTVYRRIPYYVSILDKIRTKFPEIDQIPGELTKKEELNNYVLIIDEINRANLPSVLGELIYALEYRNKKVNSMYAIDGENTLILPKNLFIIGTMNTSDRSVGHIDYAIRRRFAFVEILPEILQIENFQKSAFEKVSDLFISNYNEYEKNKNTELKPSALLNEEFRPEDVWLGHSYFIASDEEFKIRRKYEIVPILKEYIKDGILKDLDKTWEVIKELSK
ncbi:AAA family ATPase [Fluviicola sp.]|uniref:AAA family ATPase n=1 Tax=Fluviicola sp. TaxID=1917219 RepID=UPI0031E34E6C